jgi:ATP-dependent RNA helicase DHX37/DHR1
LLNKLAKVQIDSTELSLYNSVKDIGKKEKVKHQGLLQQQNKEGGGDEEEEEEIATGTKTKRIKSYSVNSITGSNKKLKNTKTERNESNNDDEESIKTDEMSSDDDENVNNSLITKAVELYKQKQIEKQKETDQQSVIPPKTPPSSRQTKYVHVERREDIKVSRSKLPIINEEQIIMETIADNDIVIICGETGSGKTTQVPQFLYEAGYADNQMIIGITEPRRIAAISMSARVNDEMTFNDESPQICSYQIRYETNVSSKTKLKFMTDGVLLKEIQVDFMLNKYSAIIIDEAHERSVFTDILIGLLSRIVPLRNKKGNPLKLIIMSATLRIEDFTQNKRLFRDTPPVINVNSRQFPVAIHFNKKTPTDYLSEAFKKVSKIHRRLPDGGILVFVTGQQEVKILTSKLRQSFPFHNNNHKKQEETKEEEEDDEIKLDNYSTMPLDEEIDFDFDKTQNYDEKMENSDDDNDDNDDVEEDDKDPLKSTFDIKTSKNDKPLHVLPLYSLLSSEKQSRIFDQVPQGARLCVVATNVAETSLTIPNMKYVVDCGKLKMKYFDKVTGVSTFRICWTSKASSDQRSGRAGRTAAGHCYRLYSSAVFNDEFPLFTQPEILRKPVEDLILQMKDLGIDRIINFPFPTSLNSDDIENGEKLLIQLGALTIDKTRIKNVKDEQVTRITKLGRTMSSFPINPRYAKMLTVACEQTTPDQHLISYIICLIAALSVNELFIADAQYEIPSKVEQKPIKVKCSKMRQQSWLNNSHSDAETSLLGDLMLLLVAVGAVEYDEFEVSNNQSAASLSFCSQYGIRLKAIIEARKLRKQITETVNLIFPKLNVVIDPLMPPPTQQQARLLRQLVLSGMVDKIAK